MSFLLSTPLPGKEMEVVDLDAILGEGSALPSDPNVESSRKRRREAKEKLQELAEKRKMGALKKTSAMDGALEDLPEEIPLEDLPSRAGNPASDTLALPLVEPSTTSKPVPRLKGREPWDVMRSRIHPDDYAATQKLRGKNLAEGLGRWWMMGEARVQEAMQRVEEYDDLKDEMKELRTTLEQREKELSTVSQKYSAIDTELSKLKSRLTEIEVEKASLDSELTRVKRESHEQLVRFKNAYTEQYQEAKHRWQASRDSSYREGFLDGARDQRLEYLLSPHGHQFLKILFEGTLDAVRLTPEIFRWFAPLIALMISTISQKTAEMVGATPEQIEDLDEEALMGAISDEEMCAILGIDNNAPPRPDWWYPVLDKAIQQFAFGVCDDPLPSEPIYSSPFLHILREFVDKLRGPGLDPSSGPRPFAAYGTNPPPIPSSGAAGNSTSKEAILQQCMASYLDGTRISQQILQSMIRVPTTYADSGGPDSLEVLHDGPSPPDPVVTSSSAPDHSPN